MTQDTRKDRRVKIVSLNVRYKSATVDEFIENHAHDVSRGGIFIKTGNPFPPGTLLKFEIRLASDQAVIAGVGRIVWKRDAGVSDGEHPGGMGVKFIKIDDPSKAVIDRLVNSKSDAGRAFENTREDTGSDRPFSRSSPPARPAMASTTPPPTSGAGRAAAPGTIPPAGVPGARAPSVPPDAAKSRLQSMPTTSATPFARKSTIMGLGISSNPPGRSSSAPPGGGATGTGSIPPAPRVPFSTAPAVPPRPTSTTAMFPRAHDDDDRMPAQEDQTVMRQAAELLEDALREAGGSMADIGQNPLFSAGAAAADTTGGKPASGSVTTARAAPSTSPDTADSPGPVPVAASVRREAVSQPASKRESASPPSSRSGVSSTRSTSPTLASTQAEPAKKKGSGAFVIAIVAAAAIAAFVAFREKLFGGGAPPEPAAVPTSPAPTTTAAAATSASAVQVPPAPPPATVEPAPSAAPEAPAASASARVEPPAAPPAPTRPPQVYIPPRPRPAARPAPAPPPTAAPISTSESAPTAEPTPAAPTATATATSAPETAPTSAPPADTAAPTATTTPPAPARPKSGKGSDDNPY